MMQPINETFLQDTSPAVSVLMPVYNNARYLPEAVESILNQTFTDFELITIDDGSTDQSLAILKEYQQRDARIKIISRRNTGLCKALNDGLEVARGGLIARMDGDDTCSPNRLAKQVDFLHSHPDCVAVGTWLMRTDPTGSPAGKHCPPTEHNQIDEALFQRADSSAIVHGGTCFRYKALREIGGWRDCFEYVEDLDLFLRLAEVGKLANIPEVLYYYRRHLTSVCVHHYATRRVRFVRALQAAYDRRGIQQKMPDFDQDRKAYTRAVTYRHWACHAIDNQNLNLARRHALAAIRSEPFSITSWKVMYWAMTG